MTASETDPRPDLDRALDQASQVIAKVAPGQLGDPTPCAEFTVTDLLGHLVGVTGRIQSLGRREPQGMGLAVPTGVAHDQWQSLFDVGRAAAMAAWAGPQGLEGELTMPWGETFSAATVVGIYTLEVVTHTWDLAVAVDAEGMLDPSLASVALAVASVVLPPDPRGGMVPFGPVVPVPDDAPAYDRLAAFTGRDPSV